jgi:hypothetical protein
MHRGLIGARMGGAAVAVRLPSATDETLPSPGNKFLRRFKDESGGSNKNVGGDVCAWVDVCLHVCRTTHRG